MKSPDTSILYNNKCCICDGSGRDTFFRDVGGHCLHKCNRCDLIYLKSVGVSAASFIAAATEDRMNIAREKTEYWSFPDLYKKHRDVFEQYFAQRLRRIKRYFPHAKSVADLGAGYGFWLHYCKAQGLDCVGIEMVPKCYHYARDWLEVEMVCADINECIPKTRYDVVVLCDVLEHQRNPLATLKHIHAHYLAEGGGLFVQVPDVIGIKIPYRHSLGLPHHIWQFNKESLGSLLEKAEFDSVAYWTGVQGVIGEYERGGPSLFKRLLWRGAGLLRVGNRLQVLARKSEVVGG